jgi:hypothetical protein
VLSPETVRYNRGGAKRRAEEELSRDTRGSKRVEDEEEVEEEEQSLSKASDE